MNNVQRTLIIGLVLVGTLLWTSSPALADSLTYTETDVASGNLGAASFSNALVTITLVGDTSALMPTVSGFQIFGPATVSVQGIGTASFTDSMYVFDDLLNSVVGISDFNVGVDVLDIGDPAFGAYDLTTAIAGITDSSGFNTYNFGTSGGDLVLTSDSGTATFTATAVPEPGSLFLLGVGLSGLVCARRKKTRSASA